MTLSSRHWYFISLFFVLVSIIVQAQNWQGPKYTIGASGTGAEIGYYFKTAVVNGYPAIAYTDETHQNIMYVRANDSSGTTWGDPVIIEAIGVSANGVALAVVNGNPAIVYDEGGNSNAQQLRYKRANDVNGTTWPTAVIIDW